MAPPIPNLPIDGSQSPSAARFRKKSPSIRPHTLDIFTRSPTLKPKSPKPILTSSGALNSLTGSGSSDLFPKSKDLLRRLSGSDFTNRSIRGVVRTDSPAERRLPVPNNTPVDNMEGRKSTEETRESSFMDAFDGISSGTPSIRSVKKFELTLPSFMTGGDGLRNSPGIKAFIDENTVEEEEEEEAARNLEEEEKVKADVETQQQSSSTEAVPETAQKQTPGYGSLAGPILVEYENSPYRLIPPGLYMMPNHLGLEVTSGGFHIGQVLVAQGSYKACLAGEFTVSPGETFQLLGVYQDGWGIGYRRVEKRPGKIPRERFYERELVGPTAFPGRVDINLLALLKDSPEGVKPEDFPCVKVVDKYTNTTTLHLAFEIGIFPLAAFRNSPESRTPFKVAPSVPAAQNTSIPASPMIRRIKDDAIAPIRFASLNLGLVKSVVRGEAYEGYVPNEVARCLHMLCSAGKLKGEWWEEQGIVGEGKNGMMSAVLMGRRDAAFMEALIKEGGLEGKDIDWVKMRYAGEKTIIDNIDKFEQVKKTYVLPKGVDLPGSEDLPPVSFVQKTLNRSATKITGKIGSLRRTLSVAGGSQAAFRARSRLANRSSMLSTTPTVPEEPSADPIAEASSYLSIFPSRQNVHLQPHFYPNGAPVCSQRGSYPSTIAASSKSTTPHISRANTQHSTLNTHAARRRRIPDDLFMPLVPEWPANGLSIVSGDAAQSGGVEDVLRYLKDLEGRIVERFEGLEKAIHDGGSIGRSTVRGASVLAETTNQVDEVPELPKDKKAEESRIPTLLEWRRSRRVSRSISPPPKTPKHSEQPKLTLPLPSLSPITPLPSLQPSLSTKVDSPGVTGWKRARIPGAPPLPSSPEKFNTPEKMTTEKVGGSGLGMGLGFSTGLDEEKVDEWKFRRQRASTRGRSLRKKKLATTTEGTDAEKKDFAKVDDAELQRINNEEKLSVKTLIDSGEFVANAEKLISKVRQRELEGKASREAMNMGGVGDIFDCDEKALKVGGAVEGEADVQRGECEEVRLDLGSGGYEGFTL